MHTAGRLDGGGSRGGAVDEGVLNDRCGDVMIPGSGGEHMSAAKGCAPQGDTFVIDAVEASREGDGRAVIGALSGDVAQPARFTFAGAQVAVVKRQGGEPRGGEAGRGVG